MEPLRAPGARGQVGGSQAHGAGDTDPRLKRACTDFEALVVKQLLATAHLGEAKGPLFEGDAADETLSDLRLDGLASALTAGKGFGVAAMLQRQLTRAQPHAKSAPATGGRDKS